MYASYMCFSRRRKILATEERLKECCLTSLETQRLLGDQIEVV